MKRRRPVILIVDDIPLNIHILAQALSEFYTIRAANSGRRCLELLAAQPGEIDLILLDVNMPDMDGYEVLRQLKFSGSTSNIPVIYVTDMQTDADEEKGFSLGAVDYITKPIRPAIVQARVSTHITLKRQRDALLQMATRDQLSGLYNRHYLFEAAEQAISTARRHGNAVSVLMCDIDKFKDINDHYGHAAGDAVIEAVAGVLQQSCRREDIVARCGGEEFVIALVRCDLALARKKAESIRLAVEGLAVLDCQVTISIGVAFMDPVSDNFEALMHRADDALYRAKHEGRNRVICAEKHGHVLLDGTKP